MAATRPPDLFSQREILTPTGLNSRLQAAFDRHIGTVWVSGEIAGASRPSSGHTYFSLKDSHSLVRAVIWRSRLPKAGGPVGNGLKVLVKGVLTIYPPRGDYQLIVDYIEPQGEGALRLAYEKLLARLSAEGLFKPERRRPIPFWPRKVALLTASGGAARLDFLSSAVKRCPSASVSFYPVRVQGAGAAEEMAQALADLNQWGGFDLVVITRGGGSLEDLWAFNEEALVRAVAASRVPVLAAVGHSTDLSLVELAADSRAITPTAAAEAVFPERKTYLRQTVDLSRRLKSGLEGTLGGLGKGISSLNRRLFRFENRIFMEHQRLDSLSDRLAKAGSRYPEIQRLNLKSLIRELIFRSPAEKLKRNRSDLAVLTGALPPAVSRCLINERRELAGLSSRLKLVSPLGILSRGYALAANARGEIIRSSSAVSEGDLLDIRLAQGRITAQVVKTS